MTKPATYALTVQMEGGAQTFEIGPDPAVIGRSTENTIALNHSSISRRHCELRFTPDGIEVRDLSSANGTFVNGNQIVKSKVNPGDKLRFGQLDADLQPLAAAPSQDTGPVAPTLAPTVAPGPHLDLDEISLDDEPAAPSPTASPVAAPAPAADGPDDLELEEIEISLDDDPPPQVAAPAKSRSGGPPTGWALIVADGDLKGQRFDIPKKRILIGRTGGCDFTLKGLGVSGKHAEVVWEGDRPVLRDLESTNGVLVEGKRVAQVTLRNGTRISIGKVAVDVKGPVDEISLGDDDIEGDVEGMDIGAGLTLDDDQPAVHQLSDMDVPKKSKAGVLALAGLVLGLGAAAFFYFRRSNPEISGLGKSEAVVAPADSLIQYGFSAEESDADERWVLQKVEGAELERASTAKKSGRWGIVLTRAEAKALDGPTVALYSQKLPVDARRRYTVKAFGRVAGGESRASLLVRFLDKKDVILEESIATPISAGSFQAIELAPTAPVGAVNAEVGIVALLGNGITHFDDVTFQPSDRAAHIVSHSSNRFTIDVAPVGVWTLRSDVESPVQRFEYFVANKKRRFSQTYYFRPSGGEATQGGDELSYTGVFRGPTSEGPLSCSIAGKDTVTITYSGWTGESIDADGVRFRVTEEALKEGLLVLGGGSVSPQTGPFSIEKCEALVLGSGARPVRFRFTPPLDIDVRRGPDGILVELSRKSTGKAEPIVIELKTSLIELLAGAQTALDRGRDAIADQRYGDAFRELFKVIQDFAVKKDDIETAERLLKQVREKFRTEYEVVNRRAEQAAFFKDLREIDAVKRDAAALAAAYRDTPVAGETKSIVDALDAAAAEKKAEQLTAFAKRNLELARDFKNRGATHFAENFYASVIARCKGTKWAATAEKELGELKKIVTEMEKKG